MPDDEMREQISQLVDRAMDKATWTSAYTAAWHNPAFWDKVRDDTTAKILALVDEDRQRLF